MFVFPSFSLPLNYQVWCSCQWRRCGYITIPAIAIPSINAHHFRSMESGNCTFLKRLFFRVANRRHFEPFHLIKIQFVRYAIQIVVLPPIQMHLNDDEEHHRPVVKYVAFVITFRVHSHTTTSNYFNLFCVISQIGSTESGVQFSEYDSIQFLGWRNIGRCGTLHWPRSWIVEAPSN